MLITARLRGIDAMKGKICALIRQTWYETAKKNLQPADRLRFYEMCLEYEFNRVEPDGDAPFGARLLFDMVRADLDGDIERANAKAERSRENGRLGGRPKLSEVDTNTENPEKPSGINKNPLYTVQNNTGQNRTKESEVENEDTHTFFGICLDFFERGCSDPHGEATKFWNYYAAMGWKTKGGGDIVDRMALAKAWRLQDCSKAAMRNRVDWAKALHLANAIEPCLISEFVKINKTSGDEKVVVTFETQTPAMIFENKYVQKIASRWLPVKENGQFYDLEYRILQKPLG